MPNNSTKILFLMMLISGSLISMSANSWMGAWMGLEINLLSFIPLLTSNKNMFSTEASLKYFLIQAIASAALMFLIILKTNINEMFYLILNSNWNNMMIIPLLMKVGAAPFHWWLPAVCEGVSWTSCFLLLSVQKMAPLMLMSYLLMNSMFIQFIIIMSAILGAIGGLNQISLRKILAFSSINHMAWMISSIIMGSNLWFMYFLIYLINILVIIILVMINNLSYISQSFNSMNSSKMLKFSLFMSMLSLAGLPPFIGFFPKWIMINFMLNNLMIITSTILILTSLLTLYYYMRIMYTTIMITNSEMTWLIPNKFKQNYFKFMMTSMSVILLGMMISTLMISIY
uniref:NADH-ubiquinone oxidoreductase chain 2 n=1 Tax=Mantidae JZ-2017 TaxID=2073095 RepID=A0A343UMN8_9NEOP|nr:NADH dehydrogenase subunit 2 [Mantidae JZ-2017]